MKQFFVLLEKITLAPQRINQPVNVVKINSSGTVITTHATNTGTAIPAPTIIQSTNDQDITTTATLPASTKIELLQGPPPNQQQQHHHQQQQQQQHHHHQQQQQQQHHQQQNHHHQQQQQQHHSQTQSQGMQVHIQQVQHLQSSNNNAHSLSNSVVDDEQQQQQQHQLHENGANLQQDDSNPAQTIANAQVCIEPMTLSDVDVRTKTTEIRMILLFVSFNFVVVCPLLLFFFTLTNSSKHVAFFLICAYLFLVILYAFNKFLKLHIYLNKILSLQYSQTVLSTIQNADGTVSLIQVDPNNPIITLPDGTTAQVQGVATLHQGEGGATIQTVQSLSDGSSSDNMTVDLTEAAVSQDGQIYITSEDGQGYPVSVGNMITVPVSASMYQSMMANIQQIHTNSDGTVCITPMKVDPENSNNNSNPNNNNNNNNNNQNNTQQQQYPCYTFMAATPSLAQRLLLNNQMNSNNNNNLNIVNNNLKLCQIMNATTTTPTTTTNSSQIQREQQQQNQALQPQHTLPAGAKIIVASSNLQAHVNINNNNNNNVKKLASALMSLPIVVAPIAQFKTPQTATKSVNTSIKKKNNGNNECNNQITPKTSRKQSTARRRRLNSSFKNLPIKLEQIENEKRNTITTTKNIVDEKESQLSRNATNHNLLPMKVIKMEQID